jgi:hypothetical protein
MGWADRVHGRPSQLASQVSHTHPARPIQLTPPIHQFLSPALTQPPPTHLKPGIDEVAGGAAAL